MHDYSNYYFILTVTLLVLLHVCIILNERECINRSKFVLMSCKLKPAQPCSHKSWLLLLETLCTLFLFLYVITSGMALMCLNFHAHCCGQYPLLWMTETLQGHITSAWPLFLWMTTHQWFVIIASLMFVQTIIAQGYYVLAFIKLHHFMEFLIFHHLHLIDLPRTCSVI